MNHEADASLGIIIGISGLLVTLALSALASSLESGRPGFSGGSYLITITDAGGSFASRSLIPLHDDHTMLAVDSAEQGPVYFFGSQLCGWEPAGQDRMTGQTIDFRYPSNPSGPGVARTDYVIHLSPHRHRVTGTITVWSFALQDANPFGNNGTLVGKFTFEGERIGPSHDATQIHNSIPPQP